MIISPLKTSTQIEKQKYTYRRKPAPWGPPWTSTKTKDMMLDTNLGREDKKVESFNIPTHPLRRPRICEISFFNYYDSCVSNTF